ncbi:MAG: class III extradiol ring-cleavage dioxygenase [Burkholderiaceae bacterium]|nr:class III extradiol ring-cleavage dioxygenase [Burkholderiaceae bacterium]
MTTAPTLFISHGAPTFALEPGLLGPALNTLGQQLSGAKTVKAVLVVSPHWQTRDVKVMTSPAPETVHDFGGFPSALYDLQYPVAGHPQLAAEVSRLLSQAGWTVGVDERRGLDHGAWVPLRHLLPKADIPVFQVSMPMGLDAASAFNLGKALAPIRESGVMIVASGSMTHNLYEFRHSGAAQQDYAIEFTHWIRQAVSTHDIEGLLDYRQRAPHAQRAHPTEEHFLPLLVALGARSDDEAAQVIDGGVTNGVLSMESYAWGMTHTPTVEAKNPEGVSA